jgi:hypothetical protein
MDREEERELRREERRRAEELEVPALEELFDEVVADRVRLEIHLTLLASRLKELGHRVERSRWKN